MNTEKWIVAALVLSGLLTGCASTGSEELSLLFVQAAERVECDGAELVLHGVHPSTVYFSDRPERVVGQIATEKFVLSWADGPDSFADDPPNATLSVLVDDEIQLAVVILSDPALAGDRLTYQVQFTEGSPPGSGRGASLFIDSFHRLVDDRTHDQVKDIHRHTTGQHPHDDRTHDQVDHRTPDDRVY